MKKLTSIVKKAKATGTVLTPHRHTDGQFVVSMTRFAKDYIRVPREEDLAAWVNKDYRVRMSSSTLQSFPRATRLLRLATIAVAVYAFLRWPSLVP